MNNNLVFKDETFNFFYKMIEEIVDKKIKSALQNNELSEYGVVVSVINEEDGTKTKSAVVEILKNGMSTGNIKNNTNDILSVGDKVRVNAVNGNWNNSYINLKCEKIN